MIQRNYDHVCAMADVELLLVNDSPEESVSLDDINEIYKYKILILCNKQNRGIHYSRVHGLKEATGEFVTFLDQDDVIADTFLFSQLSHIKKNEDVVVANGLAEYASYNKVLYRYALMQWTVKYIWFYAKFDCRIISPGQCLIRKNSIPEIWTKKIMTKNGADDYFLWLLMLSQGKRFGINRESLYTHVYTSVNASHNKAEMKASVMEVLELSKGQIDDRYYRMIEKRINKSDDEKSYIVRLIEWMNRR